MVSPSTGRRRSPEVVSRNMAAVKARDSKAEVSLRKLLWRRGYRYRICRRDLPGKPDITFARERVVVFVDGDFWHARVLIEHGSKALRASFGAANAPWWIKKLTRNAERDREVTALLQDRGWTVLRLWERDILRDPEAAVERVRITLGTLRQDCSKRTVAIVASTQIPRRRRAPVRIRGAEGSVGHDRASARRSIGTPRRPRP